MFIGYFDMYAVWKIMIHKARKGALHITIIRSSINESLSAFYANEVRLYVYSVGIVHGWDQYKM